MKQNSNSIETTLKLNIAEFLAEYFTGSTSAKNQFSYGLFWDTVTDDSLESIKIMVDYMPKDEGAVSIMNMACLKPKRKWKPNGQLLRSLLAVSMAASYILIIFAMRTRAKSRYHSISTPELELWLSSSTQNSFKLVILWFVLF